MIVHDSLPKLCNVLASLLRIFFDTEVLSFPDIKFQSSIISSYIPIVVVIAKKCSTNMARPRPHLLGCISNYHSASRCLVFRFFRFSHFLAFSITVVRIFLQFIALLFFTGQWPCGSHVALSPPWLSPLTKKLSCTIHSVKRKNYHELSCRI